MQILKLAPAFKDYLWGGTKLRDIYHKPCDLEKVAESWELSTHPAGQSKISGGEYAGMELGSFIEAHSEVLGENCREFESFPVLIKFIDAKEPLSIQVHPSDEYALRVEHEYGKTEMWYVMDCEPGAYLYFGVNRELTREEFRRRIEDNTVEEALGKVEVHPGDVFFIEAGTIHAIGAGILICEIQQNSNCTYRVYDYDRRGADGKPRELHIEKALEVSKLSPSPATLEIRHPEPIPGGARLELASCKYFTTFRYRVESSIKLNAGPESFISIIAMQGGGYVQGPENRVDFVPGDSIFVPADSGEIEITGQCTLAVTRV